MTDPRALAARDGLPDALRVLVDALPRADWPDHPQFRPLAAFWLARHLDFRRLSDALTATLRTHLDGQGDPRALPDQITRLAGALLGGLDEHHRVEDHHYFPLLAAEAPVLAGGFEMLDRDHDVLHDWLGRMAEAARTAIRQPDHDATGRLHTTLTGFVPLLDRHLTDEEDLVVPVILSSGLR